MTNWASNSPHCAWGFPCCACPTSSGQPLLVGQAQVIMVRIDAIIQVVRNVATSLRPAALDMGVIPALEWLASEFLHNAGIASSLRACSDRLELDDERATAIFRLIQESLTNVARHSQASRVEIHLQRSADQVFIEVTTARASIPSNCPSVPSACSVCVSEEACSAERSAWTALRGRVCGSKSRSPFERTWSFSGRSNPCPTRISAVPDVSGFNHPLMLVECIENVFERV